MAKTGDSAAVGFHHGAYPLSQVPPECGQPLAKLLGGEVIYQPSVHLDKVRRKLDGRMTFTV